MNGSNMVLERHPKDTTVASSLLEVFQRALATNELVDEPPIRGRSLEVITPRSHDLTNNPVLDELLEQVLPEVQSYLGYFNLQDYVAELETAVVTQLPKEGVVSSFTRGNLNIGTPLTVMWVLEEPSNEVTLSFDQQDKSVTLNKDELWLYPEGWSYSYRLSTMDHDLTVARLRFNIKSRP